MFFWRTGCYFIKKPCWCGIIASLLIIVFAWMEASWANTVVTIIAVIVLLISIFGCCCKKCGVKKETPVSNSPATPPSA